jgi:5'-3' exonuclease
MILVDMNQITIGAIMAESKGKPSLNPDLIRHMVINNLRTFRGKYHQQYGELVICYDCPFSWRKSKFPQYKESRRRDRKNSDFDWSALFKLLNEIRDELIKNFPYKVLSVNNCEADDVIAVLARHHCHTERVLIISSDGDFQQLQKYPNIDQYSPILKKMIRCDDAAEYLFEHIVRGDASDGVPNILSVDDIFLQETGRQTPISKKKYDAWLSAWKDSGTTNRDIMCISNDNNVLNNINRNSILIDFDNIPANLNTEVLDQYNSMQPSGRDKIMNYFMTKGMRNLIQHASEF